MNDTTPPKQTEPSQPSPTPAGPGPEAVPKPRKPRAARRARAVAPVALLGEHAIGVEAHLVTLEYYNPDAAEVFVAGRFNDWQPRATPMTRRRDGGWSIELLLAPGGYEYRLIVDGQWRDDPLAARYVSNPFGGLNSVIEVRAWEDRGAQA